MKRKQIQTLKEFGLPNSDVARHAQVSESTVERVSREAPIEDIGDAEESAKARMGRPGKVAEFLDQIRSWLNSEPELKTISILQRLRDAGYSGGKSAVYEAVRSLRPPKSKGIVRFEGVAGEFSQHDFGTVVVRYEDGSLERIKFFASRLKYSRVARILEVPNEKTESVCRGLADAFAYFGGMPAVAVFDNPKTIVNERDGKQVKWNETFAQFSVECGFSPMATWPRRPQEKGAVENLVGFCKTFYKSFVFKDREDRIAKLEAWHEWANDERTCRATGETPRVRHLLEVERLRPMRLPEAGFTLKHTRIVRTDGFCEYEGLRYFVGLDHVGQSVTLHVGDERIALYIAGQRTSTHPRQPANGKYSVLAHQRGQLLQKSGARIYMMRQLLMDLCPAAEWMLTEIRHRRPERWERDVERLYELLVAHGDTKLRDAFVKASSEAVVGAEYVECIVNGQALREERS